MSVMMIKHKGKMVPAKKVDGKWVPDLDAKLVVNANGELVKSGETAPAPAPEAEAAPAEEPAPEAEPEEKKSFLDKLRGK